MNVLIIDDDIIFTDLLRSKFTDDSLISFAKFKEGFEYLKVHDAEIELAFLDFLLPDVIGFEGIDAVAKLMQERKWKFRVIVNSNYITDDMRHYITRNFEVIDKAELLEPEDATSFMEALKK